MTPHPTRAWLVGGFFVPVSAALAVQAVNAGAVTLSIAPGDDVAVPSGGDLTFDAHCGELDADPPTAITVDAVEALGKLGPVLAHLTLPVGMRVALRATARGPTVAQFVYTGGWVNVYRRQSARALMLAEVNGGYALGWIDDSLWVPPASGSHRTHAPSMNIVVSYHGLVCPRPVDVLAETAGVLVHAATLQAHTAFDPNDLAASLREADVEVPPRVRLRARAADLVDCAKTD